MNSGDSSLSLCARNARNAPLYDSGSHFSYKMGVVIQRNMRALLGFACLCVALLMAPLSARADSLPDAPVVSSSAAVSAPAHVPAVRHEFNRADWLIYAGVAGYRIGDYVTTERALARGGRELELPAVLVQSKPAFLGYSLGIAAGEIAASVWLHKHGHAKLARMADSLSIGAGLASDLHNATVDSSR
jgi:hypothetical protein